MVTDKDLFRLKKLELVGRRRNKTEQLLDELVARANTPRHERPITNEDRAEDAGLCLQLYAKLNGLEWQVSGDRTCAPGDLVAAILHWVDVQSNFDKQLIGDTLGRARLRYIARVE